MSDRVPSIRRKNTGNHFVRWGGRDWSLGTDHAAARRAWLDPASIHPGRLAAWQEWRASGGGPLRGSNNGTTTRPSRTSRTLGPILIDVAIDMIASYERLGHAQGARGLRSGLKRFLHLHGAARLLELATPRPDRGLYLAPVLPLLEALRDDMLTPDDHGLAYGAHTVNHELGCVRLLFQHAARRGLCPPVAFNLRRATPPATAPEDLPPLGIAWLLRIARHRRPELVPMLEAQYLTLCRTSELLTLLAAWHGDQSAGLVRDTTEWGHAMGRRGFVELVRHKNSHRGASYKRFLVITPRAAAALDAAPASPPWGRIDGYQHAVLSSIATGPRVLRDSAASNLRLAGVDSADVDLLLGHTPPGALSSYARQPWPALLERAGRLSLQ